MPGPEHESAPDRSLLEERGRPATAPHGTEARRGIDPERLLADERARIGRELHDQVIRHLFAVSLKLSSALAIIEENEASRRVHEAIAELDHTVKLIRSVVFALERGPLPQISATTGKPT